MLARLTIAAWCLWAQTALLLAVATPEGDWWRSLILGLLILAGISTLLWGMTQTCIPVQDAMRISWEACERHHGLDGSGVTELRRPASVIDAR